ncbi:hypothetical protein BDB00DRAFT_788510 [Zychaea mexicana]|uniref:uncharacterized protein n=1 Tax=Zychaea mexicana TaxID=64656 RepID=UPI0022FE6E46|nr:uncharacterized protein BDB00DRAFT_788510 [Zychaea mexicana]KAI9492685.1 hypothetical protein BDB00DRAFT_788510 [Zychaea mexicana]
MVYLQEEEVAEILHIMSLMANTIARLATTDGASSNNTFPSSSALPAATTHNDSGLRRVYSGSAATQQVSATINNVCHSQQAPAPLVASSSSNDCASNSNCSDSGRITNGSDSHIHQAMQLGTNTTAVVGSSDDSTSTTTTTNVSESIHKVVASTTTASSSSGITNNFDVATASSQQQKKKHDYVQHHHRKPVTRKPYDIRTTYELNVLFFEAFGNGRRPTKKERKIVQTKTGITSRQLTYWLANHKRSRTTHLNAYKRWVREGTINNYDAFARYCSQNCVPEFAGRDIDYRRSLVLEEDVASFDTHRKDTNRNRNIRRMTMESKTVQKAHQEKDEKGNKNGGSSSSHGGIMVNGRSPHVEEEGDGGYFDNGTKCSGRK